MGGRHAQADAEDGMALPGVLLASLVVASLVAVMFASSITSNRLTHQEADWELTLHEAEGSMEAVLGAANGNPALTTGHELPATVDTAEEERAWALDQFDAALATSPAPATLRPIPGGQALGIRPHRGGTPLDIVLGVARIGTGDDANTRVVRGAFDRSPFHPGGAILTEGDLEMSGGSHIIGTGANVHSNGDLVISGGGYAQGQYTASGGYNASGGVECEDPARPCEDPGTQGGWPQQGMPHFSARDFYDMRGDYDDVWFDLCPDGWVHAPAAPGGSPCDDTNNRIADASKSSFHEWKFKHGVWKRQGSSFDGEVYYVYRANATVAGGLGKHGNTLAMTLLIEADLSGGDPDGSKTGSLDGLSGGAYLEPVLQDVLIIADRDYKSSGGLTTETSSFIGVGEEMEFTGGQGYVGAMVAQGLDRGAASDNSPLKRANGNNLTGGAQIHYDRGLNLPLGTEARLTIWSEL